MWRQVKAIFFQCLVVCVQLIAQFWTDMNTHLLIFTYNRGPQLCMWYFTVKARTHTLRHFAIQTWTYLIQMRTYLKVNRQTMDLVLHLLWGTYAHMLLYAIWHPLLVSYDRGCPRLAVFDFSLHKCGLKVHGCRWKRAQAVQRHTLSCLCNTNTEQALLSWNEV